MTSLSRAIDSYLENLYFRALSPSHLTTVRCRLERLAQNHGPTPIAQITPAVIENHFCALESDGLASATLAGYKSTTRAFFAWAMEQKMVTANPADVLLTRQHRYSYRPVSNRPAPPDDFQAVLDALPAFAAHRGYNPRDVRDAALVSITADSARRRGEIWRLRRRDIEQALARPHKEANGTSYRTAATGKTGQQTVIFFDDTAALLRQWLSLMPPNARYLWCNVRNGEHLRIDALNLGFVRVCEYVGVPTFRFHAVRKRDVTDIIRATGDFKVGQLLAGHADERTTQMHYNDVSAERVAGAAAALAAQRRQKSDLADAFFARLEP